MVVAAQPHHGVEQAQRLQRLVEGARRVRRHTLQYLGYVVTPDAAGRRRVARGQPQHGVDALHGAVQELDRFGVVHIALPRRQRRIFAP